MSTVKFIINTENDKKIININEDSTFKDLRKTIAKELFDSDNYVNIKCMLTRPLRIFGKMTLNPGNIPHTYNEIYLNKFGLGNREIPIIVEEVKDGTMTYNSKKTRLNKNSSRNYYVSPYLREQKKDEPKKFTLDINDITHFPPLGS